MSSAPAGKFQDHYKALGVEPNSTSEVIQLAYQRLSRRYHHNNRDTADPAKFKEVTEAYEILSDPIERRAFDAVRIGGAEEPEVKFSGPGFFQSLQEETGRRLAILCLLYDRRRVATFTPSVSMRQLEAIIKGTQEELNFSVWYLRQREFVSADDRSALQITVVGMDYLTSNMPRAELVVPFMKDVAAPKESAPEPEPVARPALPAPSTQNETQVAAALALMRGRLRSR